MMGAACFAVMKGDERIAWAASAFFRSAFKTIPLAHHRFFARMLDEDVKPAMFAIDAPKSASTSDRRCGPREPLPCRPPR